MEILEKIDKLRKERGWSIYKLAEESCVTQSTMANMFSRHSTPSIWTLSMICEAFGITLSQFFEEGESKYTTEELMLLSNYRKLGKAEKTYVRYICEIMVNKQPSAVLS